MEFDDDNDEPNRVPGSGALILSGMAGWSMTCPPP